MAETCARKCNAREAVAFSCRARRFVLEASRGRFRLSLSSTWSTLFLSCRGPQQNGILDFFLSPHLSLSTLRSSAEGNARKLLVKSGLRFGEGTVQPGRTYVQGLRDAFLLCCRRFAVLLSELAQDLVSRPVRFLTLGTTVENHLASTTFYETRSFPVSSSEFRKPF